MSERSRALKQWLPFAIILVECPAPVDSIPEKAMTSSSAPPPPLPAAAAARTTRPAPMASAASAAAQTMLLSPELATSPPLPATTANPWGLGSAAVVPLAALLVATIAISASGNSVVCLIVYRKPAMRSAINLLLANLAFADIMVSATCMPFALATVVRGQWAFGRPLCDLTAFLHALFAMEAVLILASISVDRYFIIVRRKDKLNPYRAKLLIGSSWCCSLAVASPLLALGSFEATAGGGPQCHVDRHSTAWNKVYTAFAFLSIFLVPFAAMSFSYLCILNTVRKNSLRVENHPTALSVGQATKLGLPGGRHRPSRVNVDISFKTRAFTTILLLFVAYVICWAPYAVGSMYDCFGPEGRRVDALLWTVLVWLTYLNSAFNPIIYCWRIKKFREACYDLVPKTCRLLPRLPGRARRRIRPSAMYECNEAERSSAV